MGEIYEISSGDDDEEFDATIAEDRGHWTKQIKTEAIGEATQLPR